VGGFNVVTAQEFMAIPLQERVQLIVTCKARFLRDGQVISARDAF
jgi:hypothetical protein